MKLILGSLLLYLFQFTFSFLNHSLKSFCVYYKSICHLHTNFINQFFQTLNYHHIFTTNNKSIICAWMKPYISSVTIVVVSVDNNLISLQCAINLHDVHCTYWKKCTISLIVLCVSMLWQKSDFSLCIFLIYFHNYFAHS